MGDWAWPAGLFAWSAGGRTAYGITKKPASAKTTSWSSGVSRHHIEPGHNMAADDAPRRLAPLGEICVAFCQAGDDTVDLQLLTTG